MSPKRNFYQIGNKGILLVEILLAVVILSMSLVVIVHSLILSLRATSQSSRYTKAIWALDNEMVDWVLKRHITSLTSSRGDCDKPFEEYQCQMQAQKAPSSVGSYTKGLYEVQVTVQWPSGRNQKKIKAVTLLSEEETQK